MKYGLLISILAIVVVSILSILIFIDKIEINLPTIITEKLTEKETIIKELSTTIEQKEENVEDAVQETETIPKDETPEQATAIQFTDSDNGINEKIKGTCDDNKATVKTDYCSAKTQLVEYYIPTDDDAILGCQSKSITCSYLCSDGKCLPDPDQDCMDFCSGFNTHYLKYTDGQCLTAVSKSQSSTCINSGLIYENQIISKCSHSNVCCCKQAKLI